mmetsp:Transcript_63810/g.120880  ORF Transcript_63810/g.120880 Transcript_63810/m.120880 type:complete len:86 (-) Transcript_63810:98-355(-)
MQIWRVHTVTSLQAQKSFRNAVSACWSIIARRHVSRLIGKQATRQSANRLLRGILASLTTIDQLMMLEMANAHFNDTAMKGFHGM